MLLSFSETRKFSSLLLQFNIDTIYNYIPGIYIPYTYTGFINLFWRDLDGKVAKLAQEAKDNEKELIVPVEMCPIDQRKMFYNSYEEKCTQTFSINQATGLYYLTFFLLVCILCRVMVLLYNVNLGVPNQW